MIFHLEAVEPRLAKPEAVASRSGRAVLTDYTSDCADAKIAVMAGVPTATTRRMFQVASLSNITRGSSRAQKNRLLLLYLRLDIAKRVNKQSSTRQSVSIYTRISHLCVPLRVDCRQGCCKHRRTYMCMVRLIVQPKCNEQELRSLGGMLIWVGRFSLRTYLMRWCLGHGRTACFLHSSGGCTLGC